jgi:hypothetical protein
VNVVTVLEHDCPKGEQPIEWYLVTNEPIDTTEQVAAVVDADRARWVIEVAQTQTIKPPCASRWNAGFSSSAVAQGAAA